MNFNRWWDEEGLKLYKQGVQDHYLFASFAWDAAIKSAEDASSAHYSDVPDADDHDNAIEMCVRSIEQLRG